MITLAGTRTFRFLILSLGLAVSIAAPGQRRQNGTPDEPQPTPRDIEALLIEAEKLYLTEDYARAYATYTVLLDQDPDNAAAHFRVAGILKKDGALDKALFHAQKALAGDADNPYYYLQQADILERLNLFGEAADTYEELLEQVPNTYLYLNKLAATYLIMGETEKAIDAYNRLEDYQGKEPEVSYQKQKIYLAQREPEKAIAEGEALIESDPHEPAYVYALVDLLLNLNEPDRAVPYLETLLAKDQNNATAHLMLAEILREQGKPTEGIGHLDAPFHDPSISLSDKLQLLSGYIRELPNADLQAPLRGLAEVLVNEYPGQGEPHSIYGDLLFQINDREAAREQYLAAVGYDASNFELWRNIIAIDWERQEYPAVIEHTEQALAYFPNQALLYYYNGHAYYLEKEYQRAIRAMEQGARLARRNDELQGVLKGLLGDAYNATKDYAKSDAAYEDALKLNPNNVFVLNNYSYFLSLRQQKLDRAVELSRRLVGLHPNNSTYLDTHGWVLYQRKEYREAVKYLKQAVDAAGSPSGTILEHYGDALFRAGRAQEAVEQWQRALEKSPNSDSLKKKIADRTLYEDS